MRQFSEDVVLDVRKRAIAVAVAQGVRFVTELRVPQWTAMPVLAFHGRNESPCGLFRWRNEMRSSYRPAPCKDRCASGSVIVSANLENSYGPAPYPGHPITA